MRKKCNSCYKDEICYNCSAGYGVDEYGKCVKCEDSNCVNCGTNYTICTICKIDFGLIENKCIECDRCDYCYKDKAYFCSECPEGYGGNDCQRCTDENCIHYPRSLDKCTKCTNKYEISHDNCYKVPFEHFNEYKYHNQFTFAVLGTCIILTSILAPILVVRVSFTLVYVSIVSSFCFFFSILIEFIVHVCDKYSSTQIYKVKKKSYLFGINCFTLILVPATDSFIGIMNN